MDTQLYVEMAGNFFIFFVRRYKIYPIDVEQTLSLRTQLPRLRTTSRRLNLQNGKYSVGEISMFN